MKRTKIPFWTLTGLAAAAFVAGGITDLAGGAQVEAGMAHLGYPAYVATLLGVWKLLGAAAIVAPRLPRLKEWAYAGMFFDLSGAAFSHASAGDGAGKIAVPLALLAIVLGSWALRSQPPRPEKREAGAGSELPSPASRTLGLRPA
jgi:uncharacterized membrane protein YphA (DoxX/SURF4 family)